MAWNTGPACGFTAMRSCGRAISKYSAAMMEITEAQDAWWPPTFSPSRLGRMWLALWIIHADSHSSLRSSCFRMWVWRTAAEAGEVMVASGVSIALAALRGRATGSLALQWRRRTRR